MNRMFASGQSVLFSSSVFYVVNHYTVRNQTRISPGARLSHAA
jgi:hypothetical protein